MANVATKKENDTDWSGALGGIFWLIAIGYVLYHAGAILVAIPAFAVLLIARMIGALRD